MFFEILTLILSFALLAISSFFLVGSLEKISWFLELKKFVVAFLIMSLAASIPNLFNAINSAYLDVPQLSLGEVFGANIAILTLIFGVMALVSKNGLMLKCQLIQKSSLLVLGIIFLPFLLMIDNYLSRVDGIILIFIFFIYFYWVFIKKGKFRAIYEEKVKVTDFLESLVSLVISLFVLLLSSFFIVNISVFFANEIGLDLWIIGLLVTGIFVSLPETIFSIHAARAGEDELVVGSLMSSVISTLTLVLGILSLLRPFEIDVSTLFFIQFFLTISVIILLFFAKTKRRITQTEGLVLIAIYLVFLLSQIIIN